MTAESFITITCPKCSTPFLYPDPTLPCEPSPPGPTITISTPSAQPFESGTPTAGGSYEHLEGILLQVLKIMETSTALYDLSLSKDSEQLSFSFKADIPTSPPQ